MVMMTGTVTSNMKPWLCWQRHCMKQTKAERRISANKSSSSLTHIKVEMGWHTMRASGALGVLHKDKQGRLDGSTRRLKISPRYLNYVLEWVSWNPLQWCQLNARSVSDMEIITVPCDLIGWIEVELGECYQHFWKLWQTSPCPLLVTRTVMFSYSIILLFTASFYCFAKLLPG